MHKFHIITILFLMAVFSTSAKKKEYPIADIKVSYNWHYEFIRGEDGVQMRDIQMILLANNSQSRFFSPETNRKDSLQSTPEGKALNRQLLNEAIRRYSESRDRSAMDAVVYKTQLYVTKDYANKESTLYDYVTMSGKYYYTESFDEIQWEVKDSTKNILGYECIMATTDYHGRKWTAWFAPDIPVSDGPWKLQGLPGLILEATEPSGLYSFVADGIEQAKEPIYPVYSPNEYSKTTRIEMLRTARYAKNNSNAMMKSELDIGEGKDTPENKDYDFIETDYR